VVKYETAVKADKFLVIFHGAEEEVKDARERSQVTNPVESDVHLASEQKK